MHLWVKTFTMNGFDSLMIDMACYATYNKRVADQVLFWLFNPSNAKATFVQGTKMQRSLKIV